MILTLLSLLMSSSLGLCEEENLRDQAMRKAQQVEKDVGVELRKARDGARRLIKKEDKEAEKKQEKKP